ncbi:MAG TPA: hypothetical protein VN932_01090 [Rhizomicrobium sp.]|nr:hypothetical protein [Rhizomicrobium sp.]
MARMKPLEKELDRLLAFACTEYGFCFSAAAAGPIVKLQSITETEFASAVSTAEGLTPPEYSQWHKPLARLFRKHFGRAAVRAEDFKL